MTTLFFIVLANLLSRVLAVGLAAVLSFRIFSRCGNLVAAFAAGLLLTIACTHLIPEAVESGIDAHLAGGVLLDTAGAKMMLLVSTILTGVGAATVVLLVGRIRQKTEKPQQTAA